jgi:hypothetical protein
MLLCFFRGANVGTDISLYSLNFNRMSWNPSTWDKHTDFEDGFNVFLAFFKEYISSNAMLCLGTVGIIYILSVSRFVKKYSQNVNISLMLFVLLGFYMSSFNLMRQYFSLGLFLLFISSINLNYLSWKKFIASTALILFLGFFFHNTMFFLLLSLFYYIPAFEKVFSKTFMIVLVIISMIFFYTNFIILFMNNYLDLLPQVATAKMYDYTTKALTMGADRVEFSFIRSLFNSLYIIFIIYISPKTKNYFLFLYFISVISLNILTPLSTLLLRVSEMFYFFSIIYMANLWEIIKKRRYEIIYKSSILCFSIILYINMLIKNYGEIVPYTIRFLK